MPCILKEPTQNSPGIVSFTHNEALWGVPSHSRRARAFLAEGAASGKWLFGVHVQGDLSWLDRWPLQPWQSFFLWPDPAAPFLANIPREMRLDRNCINFMPRPAPRPAGMGRNVDICVISRPNTLKRLYESLKIIKGLMQVRPGLTATIIAGDPRRVELGSRTYEKQGIDRRFYQFAQQHFSARELTQISFLCSSEQAFGKFPLARELVNDIIMRSRFMMLNSHQEGTPRVIAEAFLAETPCILSRHLASGIRAQTTAANSVFIEDDTAVAVAEISDALDHYDRYQIDLAAMRDLFCEDTHIPELREWLSRKIAAKGSPVEGRWFLNDLHMRLACHGQKLNLQIMNREALFFRWFGQVDGGPGRVPGAYDPYDEDAVFGGYDPDDTPRGLQRPVVRSARVLGARVLRKLGLGS
ncbi:MAG TPA: hypothetical protein VK515_04380 [Rhizomicrobium sp.]|nr:hypothetical protein [Rhizomicrobium sp.]